jgi:hypothetical protein
MNKEQRLKAARAAYPMLKGLSNSNKIRVLNQRLAFVKGAEAEADSNQTIKLKHLCFEYGELSVIIQNVKHNKHIVCDTLINPKITRDYFHSYETNKRRLTNHAYEIWRKLLLDGFKVSFLDGSEKLMQSYSPPLYDKHYHPLTNNNDNLIIE